MSGSVLSSGKAHVPRIVMSSAYVPMPVTTGVPSARCATGRAGASRCSHWSGRPLRHQKQTPHSGVPGTRTWSPSRTRATPGPACSTTPTAACPTIVGRVRGSPRMPRWLRQSV